MQPKQTRESLCRLEHRACIQKRTERRECIPPEPLTKLLHECFKEGTRIRSDASVAVGRYMEIFVREALARAAFLRVEAEHGGGDGVLEVSSFLLAFGRLY